MTLWIADACLLGGALLSLLAAVGVLRLPDVFMRMHAATKSGVVGCGLILAGVALGDGNSATDVKVAVTILFLLLTTPVAGHLLGRAAYVSGAPFWRGTADDQLAPVLRRRRFGPGKRTDSSPAPFPTLDHAPPKGIARVVIALAQGPHMNAAIGQAIALAQQHDAELCGVAVIDARRVSNVGPVPIGGGAQAADLRKWRLAKARQAAADVIQSFESQAKSADIKWSVRVEEGHPHTVLQSLQEPGAIVAIAPGGWFDQGVLQQDVNVAQRLVNKGVYPLLVLGAASDEVRRVRFIFDGSRRSLTTWRWLLEANLWPEAILLIGAAPGTELSSIEQALQEARKRGRRAEQADASDDPREFVVIGNAASRSWMPGWLVGRRSASDEKFLAIG